MGAGASSGGAGRASSQVGALVQTEVSKPLDASDVGNERALEEVKRLRRLVATLAGEENRKYCTGGREDLPDNINFQQKASKDDGSGGGEEKALGKVRAGRKARDRVCFRKYKLDRVEDITDDDFYGIVFSKTQAPLSFICESLIPFREPNVDCSDNAFEVKKFRFVFTPPQRTKALLEKVIGPDCSHLVCEFLQFNLDAIYLRWPRFHRGSSSRLTGIIIPEVATFVEKVYRSSNRAFTGKTMTVEDCRRAFYTKAQLKERGQAFQERLKGAASPGEQGKIREKRARVSGLSDGAIWLQNVRDGGRKHRQLKSFVGTLSRYNVQHGIMKMWGGLAFHGNFDRNDGCLHGDGMVSLADGGFKRVDEIQPGDVVRSGKNRSHSAVVSCVTKQRGDFFMCKVPSPLAGSPPVLITPVHPIRLCDGTWSFPMNVGAPMVETRGTTVYNFVLGEIACKQTPSVWVSGLECIALGHLLEDPAVKHNVWGGIAIRTFLKSKPDYPIVHLPEDGFDELVEQLAPT